jgi:hypothetical protein
MYAKPTSEKKDGLNGKLLTGYNFCKTYQPAQGEVEEERVTIEQLISRVNDALLSETGPRLRLARMRQPALKFAKRANQDELETLARIAVDEPSYFIKTALLRVFSFADFPLDVGLLLPYATSDDEALRDVTVDALSRIEDQRIHALAVRLLNDGQVENALTLLEGNFETGDEALIRKHVTRLTRARHDIIGSVTKIYGKHKSNTCGDTLLHLYKNAVCSHCRCDVVETMINNGVMPENILAECQYDSYEDTRILAG